MNVYTFNVSGFSLGIIEDSVGGHGLSGVCDHINHLSYHIKGKLVWKA